MIPNKINLKFKFIEFVIEKFDNFSKYKGNKTMDKLSWNMLRYIIQTKNAIFSRKFVYNDDQ